MFGKIVVKIFGIFFYFLNLKIFFEKNYTLFQAIIRYLANLIKLKITEKIEKKTTGIFFNIEKFSKIKVVISFEYIIFEF